MRSFRRTTVGGQLDRSAGHGTLEEMDQWDELVKAAQAIGFC